MSFNYFCNIAEEAGSSSSSAEDAVVEMLLAVKETRGSKYYQVCSVKCGLFTPL